MTSGDPWPSPGPASPPSAGVKVQPLTANPGFASALQSLWDQMDAAPPASSASAASATASSAASAAFTWADPTPKLLEVDAKQLPNAGAMEIRRMKNRECMRRARLKQREELKRMKATVAALEKQYAELSLRARAAEATKAAAASPSSPSSPSSGPGQPAMNNLQVVSRTETLYGKAVEVAKRLGAENLYLRAAIQEKSQWTLQMQRILESEPEFSITSQMNLSLPLGMPKKMPARMASLPLSILDPDEARAIYGFLPLSDAGVTDLILENGQQMQCVRSMLEVGARFGDRDVLTQEMFGWSVQQRVVDSTMEFIFTKRFSGLNIGAIMRKTWANDVDLEKFRQIKYDLKRIDVLQEANPNAYILGHDVQAPDKTNVFRSVFLRYLIETSQTLPKPSSPKIVSSPDSSSGSGSDSDRDAAPLKATGYLLGTQSTNRDWSQPANAAKDLELPEFGSSDAAHEKLVWADLALSVEFVDMEDPSTGETWQEARWTGRTDYKSHAEALRNAADMLTSCLRWELHMIQPAVALVSLQLS